jgi:hypothetical protein
MQITWDPSGANTVLLALLTDYLTGMVSFNASKQSQGVGFVGADFMKFYDRGNRRHTLSFTKAIQYSSVQEAMIQQALFVSGVQVGRKTVQVDYQYNSGDPITLSDCVVTAWASGVDEQFLIASYTISAGAISGTPAFHTPQRNAAGVPLFAADGQTWLLT